VDLERLWYFRQRPWADCSFADQACLRAIVENPGAGNREVAAAASPYRVSHVHAAAVRARHDNGELVVDERMLLMIDGKPTGSPLEALIRTPPAAAAGTKAGSMIFRRKSEPPAPAFSRGDTLELVGALNAQADGLLPPSGDPRVSRAVRVLPPHIGSRVDVDVDRWPQDRSKMAAK
jgi:hypothetical protein